VLALIGAGLSAYAIAEANKPQQRTDKSPPAEEDGGKSPQPAGGKESKPTDTDPNRQIGEKDPVLKTGVEPTRSKLTGEGKSKAAENGPEDASDPAFWKPSRPFSWHDTARTAVGTSRPTADNNEVRYRFGCPSASDDGKYCASIAEVVVELGPDVPQSFRLKSFETTRENCSKAVRISSGPTGRTSTVDCHFEESGRKFVLHQKGWTRPQTFTSEITIQQRLVSQ